MALTMAQFQLVDLAQDAIDQEDWMRFEEIHPILSSAYQTEKISGSPDAANELADATRRLTKQYRQIAIDGMDSTQWIQTDGGRESAGFLDPASGDCVVRAISIGCNLPYLEVWKYFRRAQKSSPDKGVLTTESARFLREWGWVEKPSTLRVADAAHLIRDGIISCHLLGQGHMVAVKDRKYLDSWNSGGLRSITVWLSPDSPYR